MPLLKADLTPVLPKRGAATETAPLEQGDAILASSGPLGTSQDIADDPVSNQISLYVVRPNDTLSSVAAMYGVSVNTIVWANNLQSRTIKEGQTLVILPVSGILYTVKKGDTIQSIAKKYKADVGEILVFNNLSGTSVLTVGDTLTIPDAENIHTPNPLPAPNTPAAKMQALLAELKHNSSARTSPLRGANGPEFDNYYSSSPFVYFDISD